MASRTATGIVIWPLLVTLAVMMAFSSAEGEIYRVLRGEIKSFTPS